MKKVKIKPYLYQLISKNLVYLISTVLIFIFFLLSIKIGLGKISTLDTKNKSLTTDINALQTKYSLLNNPLILEENLDEDIVFLNQLIPNSEDYFSIIYALENLSQKTNFNIVSYNINLSSSTKNRLKLLVSGIGDINSFMNFLETYNFAGGRLITAEKISLSPQIPNLIGINLTFYNKKISYNSQAQVKVNENIFEKISTLKKKVSFNFTQNAEENLDLSYPRKSNPF